MVTLRSHTSHALQPLDIICFKPFKNFFKKKTQQWQEIIILNLTRAH